MYDHDALISTTRLIDGTVELNGYLVPIELECTHHCVFSILQTTSEVN